MALELELGEWQDGAIRLVFWDALQGEDNIFTLHDDGTASVSMPFYGGERLEPVNLVKELLLLAKKQGADANVTR